MYLNYNQSSDLYVLQDTLNHMAACSSHLDPMFEKKASLICWWLDEACEVKVRKGPKCWTQSETDLCKNQIQCG